MHDMKKKKSTNRRKQKTYEAPEEMQHSVFVGTATGGGLLG